ncbi:hypothetical protein, partial [Campylobacter portucalensis]|uniref:hypothetical protein n=1 Tax=Campylobacter portucalensis TaxID=2608384 RepID=UPI0018A6C49C
KCTKVEKIKYPEKYLTRPSRTYNARYFTKAGTFLNSLCKYEKQKHQGEGNWDLVYCDKIKQETPKWHLKSTFIKLPHWDLEYFEPGMIAEKQIIYPMIHVNLNDGTYNPDPSNAQKNRNLCYGGGETNCYELDVCTEFKTGITFFDKRLASRYPSKIDNQ